MHQLLNIVVVLLVFFFSLSTISKFLNRYLFVNKYKNILELLEYLMGISYKTIYDDQILPFTSNLSTIPDIQLETIERNFIKFCYSLFGDKNIKLFIDFFGNEKSLITHMTLYVRKRIAEDEISQIINKQAEQTSLGK